MLYGKRVAQTPRAFLCTPLRHTVLAVSTAPPRPGKFKQRQEAKRHQDRVQPFLVATTQEKTKKKVGSVVGDYRPQAPCSPGWHYFLLGSLKVSVKLASTLGGISTNNHSPLCEGILTLLVHATNAIGIFLTVFLSRLKF